MSSGPDGAVSPGRTATAPVYPQDLRALIAIDLGAESCRVSLLRWLVDGPEVRMVYRFRNEAVLSGDKLRWPLVSILNELDRGLRMCAEIASEGIRSVAVDGWAVDYVRLDDEGVALAEPFCYRDGRTLAAQEAAHASISQERMREITGIQISRINTAYQLFADAPDAALHPWLNLPEYVLHRLGGERVAERTNASHSQLLRLDGHWSEEIFEALHLRLDHAPRLVSPGTDVGSLKGLLSELPAFRDTRLIAPACHDTASAIAGIAAAGEEWAYISSGTWSLVGAYLDEPVHTAASAAANFTNLAGADEKVCFHKSVNGLWLLRQCMERWCATGAELSIAAIVKAAEAIAPRGYVLDVDEPDLLLPGDMPGRINAQLRRRSLPELDTSPAGAPAMASFLFHSLAARYAEVLNALECLSGRRFRHLYIVGGGSQNALLNRLTEEATGLKIMGTEAESSTLGNFAVQLATLERAAAFGQDRPDRNTSAWAALLRSASRVS